ncbi:phosphoglycerate kinase [Candidatus Gracilibacteria bacterium]|nr:phosphoglycerate kinase [Candidatus Gracilibacteria bacterium]
MIHYLDETFPQGKTVLVRVDFNVPRNSDGLIADARRILAHQQTIRFLLKKRSKIILLSHLGDPKGVVMPLLSFRPLVQELSSYIDEPLIVQDLAQYQPVQSITLLENIRFEVGEEQNDAQFATKLAALGDIYINDAFSVSHRSHASTVGIAKYLPSYAGLSWQYEYEKLTVLLNNPLQPQTLIVGGKKLSDKIGVLQHLLPKVDRVLIGGACAHPFYQAQGKDIGKSYTEPRLVPLCRELLNLYPTKISLPIDFVVKNHEFCDIGPNTVGLFIEQAMNSRSIIWAGPMGKYEEVPFEQGSKQLLRGLVDSHAQIAVGGGDTLAVLSGMPESNRIDFLCLGGGAMLEFLEKETLPGIKALDVEDK